MIGVFVPAGVAGPGSVGALPTSPRATPRSAAPSRGHVSAPGRIVGLADGTARHALCPILHDARGTPGSVRARLTGRHRCFQSSGAQWNDPLAPSSSTSTARSPTRCPPISSPGPPSPESTGCRSRRRAFTRWGASRRSKIAALLIQEAGLSLDPQVISLEKEQAYFDSLAPEGIHAIAPVLELARRHRAEGPLAIGSGGVRRVVMRSLEALGITDWFGAIVAAEDTAHHKPEPGRVPGGRAPPERGSRHLHGLRGHGYRSRSRPPRRHARRRRETLIAAATKPAARSTARSPAAGKDRRSPAHGASVHKGAQHPRRKRIEFPDRGHVEQEFEPYRATSS